MRTLAIAVLVTISIACAEPKSPAAPDHGSCSDGAPLGGGEIACSTACTRDDKGPQCVALAQAPQGEACGLVSCGAGCSCASDPVNTCICPKLGPP